MKKKTIEKVINSKFDDWLSTIKDERISHLIESNTIITGGCIASMLLRERINDYDVYFTNKETALEVANYYVKKMLEKEKFTFENSDKEIPITVKDEDGRIYIYIKSAGIVGEGARNDYQYFESRPPEEGEDYVENVVGQVEEQDETFVNEESKEKYHPVFMSANAITLSNQIQVIVRFYGNPDEIHQHYDYLHCTNYWTSKDRKVVFKQPALESLLSKELIYIGSKYPIASVIRTRKFLKRGWTINAGQYLKMCYQISMLDLNDVSVLEDQLIGVDSAYFGQLIHGLREHREKEQEKGNEFKVDFGYLSNIIDKIF